MKNLNENERKALEAIIEACDDLDGELFTTLPRAVLAAADVLGGGEAAGRCISKLTTKGYLSFQEVDYEADFDGRRLWVNA